MGSERGVNKSKKNRLLKKEKLTQKKLFSNEDRVS